MKSKIFLILMVSIFVIQGCNTNRFIKMSAFPIEGQDVGYQENVTSQMKHFVSLAPYREQNPADGRTSFILFVKNCGEEPVNISSDNVSVIFEGNTNKWASRRIAVLSFDDLMNEARRKRSEAASALYLSNKKSYQEAIDDYYRWATSMGLNYEATNSVVHLASLMSSRRLRYNDINKSVYDVTLKYAQINDREPSNIQEILIEELVMKPQILLPGESSSGLVVCDTTDMNNKVEGNFQVLVSFNGEEHEFTFNRSLSDTDNKDEIF